MLIQERREKRVFFRYKSDGETGFSNTRATGEHVFLIQEQREKCVFLILNALALSSGLRGQPFISNAYMRSSFLNNVFHDDLFVYVFGRSLQYAVH